MQTISYQQFENFANKLNQHHFFHSINWTKSRQQMGWECEYLGLFENNTMIAACIVQLKNLPKLNYKMLYIPKGMVIDYENEEHLKAFSTAIKAYAKQKKAYVVKIDPEIKRYDIDLEGNPLNEETTVVNKLKNVGFKHLGFFNNFEGINSRHTFVLHYKDRSEEELFKLLKTRDRTKINKSKRLGVYLEEGSIQDLDDFMEVMQITADRGNYQIRTKEFFEIIMNNFDKDILRLVFTKINLVDYLKVLNKNIEELEQALEKKESSLNNEELSKKLRKKLVNESNEHKRQLDNYYNDVKYVQEMHQKYKKDIVNLSTSFYTYYHGRVYYWYSGSIDDFRNLNAVKFQMWDVLTDSIDDGYKSFDFMGTSGILDTKDKNYGLYKFKKTFGGDWEEYIGEFDLVIHPFIYKIASSVIPKLQTSRNNVLIDTLKKFVR